MKLFYMKFWLSWCQFSNNIHDAELSQNVIVSSPRYQDLKMITNSPNFFSSRSISKGMATTEATLDCSRSCALEPNCFAFHFCTDDPNFYTCELLHDNLCFRYTLKTFVPWTGCSLWDKPNIGRSQSCIDNRFGNNGVTTCEMFKPGCSGVWPNCINCPKTCYDKSNITAIPNTTFWWPWGINTADSFLWPEGDASDSLPILAQCMKGLTVLMKRYFRYFLYQPTNDYRISFEEINRLYRVSLYRKLRFVFESWQTQKQFSAFYSNSYIDANGTISNLTFDVSQSGLIDIFGLRDYNSKFAFANVADDRYGCGSFWLLDNKNASYCPGGNVSMFGTYVLNGSTVLRTGIKFPNVSERLDVATVYFY